MIFFFMENWEELDYDKPEFVKEFYKIPKFDTEELRKSKFKLIHTN